MTISLDNKKHGFIYVVDNFFDEDYFNNFKNYVIQQNYPPRTNDYSGVNNKLYHHIVLDKKSDHCQHTYKTIKKHFECEVKTEYAQSFLFLSFGHEKATIHSDPCLYNCMVYVQGEDILQNGTSFYVKDKEKKFVLHSVIGFKENRAVLFDGSILHASSQYMDSSKPRHIMTNFFWNRETE